MHKTLDSLFQLHEGAVGDQIDDLAAQAAAHGEAALDVVPRIAHALLQPEADTLAIAIHVQNHHFQLLANLDHLARMLDAAPAHVRDVQQTVESIEIDEHTEIGDVLRVAQAYLARLDRRQQLALLHAQTFLDQLATRHDDVAALFVDLKNLEIKFLANEIVGVVHRRGIDLGARQEGVHAIHVHDQAALDAGHDQPLDNSTFLAGSQNLVPLDLLLSLLLAEYHHPVVVLNLDQQKVKHIIDADRRHILEFVPVNNTLGLVANIDEDFVAADFQDLALDNRPLGEVFEGVCVELRHVVAIGAFKLRKSNVDVRFTVGFFEHRVSLPCYHTSL